MCRIVCTLVVLILSVWQISVLESAALAPECLHGCLGQSKREPMTGPGFQHLATVQKVRQVR
jgi:hypothetical protein